MSHSPERAEITSSDTRVQRTARLAARVGAGFVVAYGAFVVVDAAARLAETVAEPLNLSTEFSAKPVHNVFDVVTPDFVVDPIAERMSPDWAPIGEVGVGLTIALAGIGGFVSSLPRVDKQA